MAALNWPSTASRPPAIFGEGVLVEADQLPEILLAERDPRVGGQIAEQVASFAEEGERLSGSAGTSASATTPSSSASMVAANGSWKNFPNESGMGVPTSRAASSSLAS